MPEQVIVVHKITSRESKNKFAVHSRYRELQSLDRRISRISCSNGGFNMTKRRPFTASYKVKVVLELPSDRKTMAEIARQQARMWIIGPL